METKKRPHFDLENIAIFEILGIGHRSWEQIDEATEKNHATRDDSEQYLKKE